MKNNTVKGTEKCRCQNNGVCSCSNECKQDNQVYAYAGDHRKENRDNKHAIND